MYRADETHSESAELWEVLPQRRGVPFVGVMILDLSYVNTTKKSEQQTKSTLKKDPTLTPALACLAILGLHGIHDKKTNLNLKQKPTSETFYK